MTFPDSTTSNILITSLHFSRIPPVSLVTIYLWTSTGFQSPHSAPIFLSPFQKFVSINIFHNFWGTFKLLLLSGDVEIFQGCVQSTRIQSFLVYLPEKLIGGFNKIQLLRVQRQILTHNFIKAAMA